MPGNIQKILTEICHHFWLKNDGEKWSRKKYFEIPRWPSEIPAKGRCNYGVDIFQIKNNRFAGFEICIKKQNSLVLKLKL